MIILWRTLNIFSFTTRCVFMMNKRLSYLVQYLGKLLQFTQRDKIQPCHVLNPLLWFGLHCIQIQCRTTCMKWKLNLKAADLSGLWLVKLHKNSDWTGLQLKLHYFFFLDHQTQIWHRNLLNQFRQKITKSMISNNQGHFWQLWAK